MADDRRWGLLEESREPLLRTFGSLGVVLIEFVGAFPELDSVGVWLGTSTDQERDALDRAAASERVWYYAMKERTSSMPR
jgi:hypothetical protein